MGSFNSAPKILNDDNQDKDVCLPEAITRNDLLQHCQKHLQFYPMIKRKFQLMDGCEDSINANFEKLNKVSKGNYFIKIFSFEKNMYTKICQTALQI